MKTLIKSIVTWFIFIIAFAVLVSLLKSNEQALTTFVGLVNSINNIVGFIFKGFLILFGIALVINIKPLINNFLKLGETTTNPQARVEVISNIVQSVLIPFSILGIGIALKLTFVLLMWIISFVV